MTPLSVVAASAAHEGFRFGLVAAAFGFGFRHGIDWDHIAALTDISSSQDSRRRSMAYCTLYALGHALVVFVLGCAAILLAARLPAWFDRAMERVVGVTLVGLGVFVVWSLVRHGRDFRMRSRWMLAFAGVRQAVRWALGRIGRRPVVVVHEHDHPADEVHHHEAAHHRVPVAAAPGGAVGAPHRHRHRHRHVGTLPDDPFSGYGRLTAFVVGMIHGIGAETPTQVLVFLAAAGAGGKAAGLLVLACFVLGLVSSNTVVAVAGTWGLVSPTRNFPLYAAVSVATAVFSLVVGTAFLLGGSARLPTLAGG